MKGTRAISLLLALGVFCLGFAGCAPKPAGDAPDEDGEKAPNYIIIHEDAQKPDEGGDAADEGQVNPPGQASFEDEGGRFKVTLPDIFIAGPEEAQPEDGLYLQTEDGAAYLTIETTAKVASSNEELTDYIWDKLEALAVTRDDGTVTYSTRFPDGDNTVWAEFVYMRLLESRIVRVSFTFIEEKYDVYQPYCSQIGITV